MSTSSVITCDTVVQSSGYGGEQGTPQSGMYQDRLDQEFAIMGSRGITILAATGDYGTGSLFHYNLPSQY